MFEGSWGRDVFDCGLLQGRAGRILAPLAAVVFTASSAGAVGEMTPLRRPDVLPKRPLVELIGEVNEEAGRLFQGLESEQMRGDWFSTRSAYREATGRFPELPEALRARVLALGGEHRQSDAILLARLLVITDDTPLHQSLLAAVLTRPNGVELGPWGPVELPETPPPPELLRDAGEAVRGALHSTDEQTILRGCEAAVLLGLGRLVRLCIRSLERAEAAPARRHLYRSLLARRGAHWDDARRQLDLARDAGLDDEIYDLLLSALDREQPFTDRYQGPATIAAVAYAVGFLLIALTGVLLSGAAESLAEEATATPGGEMTGAGRGLRVVYTIVLWLCSLWYYLSLPLVLAAVVAVGGGIIWGMLQAPVYSPRLLFLAVVFTVGTCMAVILSVFYVPEPLERGRPLDLGNEKEFRGLLEEIAQRLGTRPIQEVLLTPGAELSVTEEGGFFAQLFGRSRRRLELGVGLLAGLRVDAFRSILAHEYGHFINRDTAGGQFALRVRTSLLLSRRAIGGMGFLALINPAYWMLNAFYRLFVVISHGATRLQEVQADRRAVATYGSEPFERGLHHVVRRSIELDILFGEYLQQNEVQSNANPNLYEFTRDIALPDESIEAEVNEIFDQRPVAEDTHPCGRDRIRWARKMAVEAVQPDDREAWTLFLQRKSMETNMTRFLWKQLEQAAEREARRAES